MDYVYYTPPLSMIIRIHCAFTQSIISMVATVTQHVGGVSFAVSQERLLGAQATAL